MVWVKVEEGMGEERSGGLMKVRWEERSGVREHDGIVLRGRK